MKGLLYNFFLDRLDEAERFQFINLFSKMVGDSLAEIFFAKDDSLSQHPCTPKADEMLLNTPTVMVFEGELLDLNSFIPVGVKIKGDRLTVLTDKGIELAMQSEMGVEYLAYYTTSLHRFSWNQLCILLNGAEKNFSTAVKILYNYHNNTDYPIDKDGGDDSKIAPETVATKVNNQKEERKEERGN